MNADEAWQEFCQDEDEHTNKHLARKPELSKDQAPECSPIYISTKTKIGYLNQAIPLEEMFWAIDVVRSYALPVTGIVKKEMKFKTTSKEALKVLCDKVDAIAPGPFVQQSVKTHVDGDSAAMKFKDIRKVSVGLCRKQMKSFRSKAKGAFFNCFAVILRLKWEGQFKEMHVKVFNTGKLEIPGIPGTNTDLFLTTVLDNLVQALAPISEKLQLPLPLDYRRDYNETVLTNSNFTANYLIDREKLTHILRQKYRILTTYDPCSYPGVQSKFFFVSSREAQDGRPLTSVELEMEVPHIVVPVMVFRTGSVLIVGKFDDDVLFWVYDFVRTVLQEEFATIQAGEIDTEQAENMPVRKNKKRFINVLASA